MDKNKKVTYADKDASWELYVELNTNLSNNSSFVLAISKNFATYGAKSDCNCFKSS
jgi:hypothetical protein